MVKINEFFIEMGLIESVHSMKISVYFCPFFHLSHLLYIIRTLYDFGYCYPYNCYLNCCRKRTFSYIVLQWHGKNRSTEVEINFVAIFLLREKSCKVCHALFDIMVILIKNKKIRIISKSLLIVRLHLLESLIV